MPLRIRTRRSRWKIWIHPHRWCWLVDHNFGLDLWLVGPVTVQRWRVG